MRHLLILFCSLFTLLTIQAQEYVTDATLEKTVVVNDDELKILYFTAVWCGPCKMMAPVMASLDTDPAVPVSIYKLDTDKNKADDFLRVRSIPTYYFIKNGH
ncbi:MAG: thioredoxin domain-containing protein, partial [Nonlabens sp.]|nr:thioredoxin domain-containing protein [Nonlabens sp.]